MTGGLTGEGFMVPESPVRNGFVGARQGFTTLGENCARRAFVADPQGITLESVVRDCYRKDREGFGRKSFAGDGFMKDREGC